MLVKCSGLRSDVATCEARLPLQHTPHQGGLLVQDDLREIFPASMISLSLNPFAFVIFIWESPAGSPSRGSSNSIFMGFSPILLHINCGAFDIIVGVSTLSTWILGFLISLWFFRPWRDELWVQSCRHRLCVFWCSSWISNLVPHGFWDFSVFVGYHHWSDEMFIYVDDNIL